MDLEIIWQLLFGKATAIFPTNYKLQDSARRLSQLCGKDMSSILGKSRFSIQVSDRRVRVYIVHKWPAPRLWGSVVFSGELVEAGDASILEGAFQASLQNRIVSVSAIIFGAAYFLLGIFRYLTSAGADVANIDLFTAPLYVFIVLFFQILYGLSEGRGDENKIRTVFQQTLE